jgi:hypothetical protein
MELMFRHNSIDKWAENENDEVRYLLSPADSQGDFIVLWTSNLHGTEAADDQFYV